MEIGGFLQPRFRQSRVTGNSLISGSNPRLMPTYIQPSMRRSERSMQWWGEPTESRSFQRLAVFLADCALTFAVMIVGLALIGISTPEATVSLIRLSVQVASRLKARTLSVATN